MWKHLFRLCLCCALLLPDGAALGQAITSVSPSAAAPGTVVTVLGGPFSEGTTLLLGDRPVVPALVNERQLAFTLPLLAPGEYVLLVRDGKGPPQTITLRVIEPPPRIDSLAPANINVCSAESERRVVVTGRHFFPGATLLLDGNAVRHTPSSPDSLTFTPPPLAAGAYGVQIVNPDGEASLPHALYFNDVPEILVVRQGEEFVNHYQLVIEGKNFTADSMLVVSEAPVGFFAPPPHQRLIRLQGDAAGSNRLPGPSQADNLRYVDCKTLVYNRYPYSSQPKEVTLRVVNPNGKETSAYRLSTP